MRLIPLHNVLYAATKTLGADAAALKLLPLAAANWAPCALVLGDTAQIQALDWQDDAIAPVPRDPCITRTLFGIKDALTLYKGANNQRVQLKIELSEALLNAMPGQFINHQRRGVSSTSFANLWLAFTFDKTQASLETLLEELAYENGANSKAEMLLGVAAQSLWGLYQSTQAHADPITGLPGAADFHERLRRACRRSSNGSPLVLLLMKLDNYLHRRRRFGHEHTDQWLRQAAGTLEKTLRKEDGLFRFGDAQFAVVANVADAQGADKLATKLLEASRTLAHSTELASESLSIGYIYHGPKDSPNIDSNNNADADPQRLSLSAEQALDQAALLGGNQALAFSGTFDTDTASMSHPQGSMLTADPAKDYRNSHILWHTISLVAAQAEPTSVCRAFINLLEESLSSTQVLLLADHHGDLCSLAQTEGEEEDSITPLLTPLRQQFVRQALAQKKAKYRPTAMALQSNKATG
jgi:diguanylate cyclase (GGDEF)-like protein